MEAIGSFKKLVKFYQTSLLPIPDESNLSYYTMFREHKSGKM
jgi:hypothetical protein